MKFHTLYYSITILILTILFPFSSKAADSGNRYAANSLLAEGKWVKIEVGEDGIYKLTYDNLKKMGFTDPSKVKVYGYGGRILDENFSNPYIDDLPEVPVYTEAGSFILFYGRGSRKWSYNSSGGYYTHQNNPYSTKGYYFLTESDAAPRQLETMASVSNTSRTVDTFMDYVHHERDSISILNSGRELYGESFMTTSTRSYSLSMPGITSDQAYVRLSFVATPSTPTPVSLSLNGETLLSTSVPSQSYGSYTKASLVQSVAIWSGDKSDRFTVAVNYSASGSTLAMLDFFTVNAYRTLRYYGEGYTFFRHPDNTKAAVQYSIGNANSSLQVWNVTDVTNVRRVETAFSSNTLTFGAARNTSGNEFVLVDPAQTFPAPTVVGGVTNQNLHALPQTDYVIISPEPYMTQAERLAEYHRTHSGLHVTVVQDTWIYNEFASGNRDATAYRRFLKMFYDRAETDEDKPKYLLLFGDAIFDNRHLTANGSKLNPSYYLLSYQVENSLTTTASFGTDDYFGLLGDNGIATVTGLYSSSLDLGIGRFPVSTVTQAENMVDKVIGYMNNTQFGNWKNKTIFTADNTDYYNPGSFCVHATQARNLVIYLEENHPEYINNQYYMDTYTPVIVNGKKTYPEAKQAFLSTLNDGCFLLNYVGHGSVRAWSSEDMLEVSDIRNMKFENLPLWITATCDFGWFDNFITSGGEEAFLNKTSGAIALFTTSRVVNSRNNYEINRCFIRYLFGKQEGEYLRLGDVFRESKNDLGTDSNKLNYVLLGDPALRLNYPENDIELTSINGVTIEDGSEFELKALENVTLEGAVKDESGNVISGFNGELNVVVYDSKQTIQSVTEDTDGGRFSYESYPNIVYFGTQEVVDGLFRVNFNVPLDITYTRDNGKMNFYAYDTSTKQEANGKFLNYMLAGTSDNSSTNKEGPVIREIYLNTNSFRDGDDVNETPYFYARVYDEDGINITGSGFGHDIMIAIDNNPNTTYYLNAFYHPISTSEGIVGYSIPELSEGEHTLVFRVWDILNNPTTDTLTFNVVKGMKVELYDITALENPAKTTTNFLLTHNMPETTLNVTLRVYDLAGRAVWSYTETGSSSFLKDYSIEWNLTNNTGGRVQPGVYVYKAAVSTATSRMTTKAKKIIVLGQ